MSLLVHAVIKGKPQPWGRPDDKAPTVKAVRRWVVDWLRGPKTFHWLIRNMPPRGGRRPHPPSDAWQKRAASIIRLNRSQREPFRGFAVVTYRAVFQRPKRKPAWWPSGPDEHRLWKEPGLIPYKGDADVDNVGKNVLDALEKAGIFENDSWCNSIQGEKCCTELDGEPRVEIWVDKFEFEQRQQELA